MKMLYAVAFSFTLLIGICFPVQATIYYVSKDGCNLCDGLTWDTAKLTILGAMNAASAGDEIWVAAGTYKTCFQVKEKVSLYGGLPEMRQPGRHGTGTHIRA